MKKRKTLFIGPVGSRSGYGGWADDIAHSLLKSDKLDVQIFPTNWGACTSKLYHSEKDKALKASINREIAGQPDVMISLNLPHGQNPIGKFNINISAIVEVDRAYPNLVQGVNSHQLQIVCSQFCKDVLNNSEVKPKTPIEVCPWATDVNTFKVNAGPDEEVNSEIGKVKEKEAFLFVGQLTHGKPFCDRKNMDNLVKYFCETFADKMDAPALILKTSGVHFSIQDRKGILERINHIKGMVKGRLPNVYLIHGELSPRQMAALYVHPKVIAHISLTHGESWGAPLLEASLSGKPVFAPNYSGHTEFLTDKKFLIDGELKTIPKDVVSEYFPPGSRWFDVRPEAVKEKLLNFFNNRAEYNEAALELAAQNTHRFNLEKLDYRLNKIINKYLP